MIWEGVRRALPSTAMLSTMGGATGSACGSWAASAAGPPNRRATAAWNGRKRCIGTGWEVSAPAPGRGPAPATSGLGPGQRPEHQPLAVGRDVHLDLVAPAELAQQDLLAERVLDELLDRPLERSGAIVLVVALLHQEVDRALGEPDLV